MDIEDFMPDNAPAGGAIGRDLQAALDRISALEAAGTEAMLTLGGFLGQCDEQERRDSYHREVAAYDMLHTVLVLPKTPAAPDTMALPSPDSAVQAMRDQLRAQYPAWNVTVAIEACNYPSIDRFPAVTSNRACAHLWPAGTKAIEDGWLCVERPTLAELPAAVAAEMAARDAMPCDHYLVTLTCGHKIATRVRYPCRECDAQPAARVEVATVEGSEFRPIADTPTASTPDMDMDADDDFPGPADITRQRRHTSTATSIACICGGQ
jgi:hypothetical protein